MSEVQSHLDNKMLGPSRSLSQIPPGFITKLLVKSGLGLAVPADTPLVPGKPLSSADRSSTSRAGLAPGYGSRSDQTVPLHAHPGHLLPLRRR